jgi:solute carrier family 66 (lysosomal lysine-arginine transporter), member 1
MLASTILFGFSIFFYSIVSIPQFVLNWKKKSADGIDWVFVFIWVYADYFALISVIRKNLEFLFLVMSMYHFICSILLCVQKAYYSDVIVTWKRATTNELSIFISTIFITFVFTLLTFSNEFGMVFAEIAGWTSCLLYIVSPIPQIVYNFRRRSVDGLSSLLFIFSIIGNTLFVTSVFVKDTDFDYIKGSLPIIATDISVTLLYITICLQIAVYQKRQSIWEFFV